MFDNMIIALGIASTILGTVILFSEKGFIFWSDRIVNENDLSKDSNFINRWVRGGVFLGVGIGILIIFLT